MSGTRRLLLARTVVSLAFFGATLGNASDNFWLELLGTGCLVFLTVLALMLFSEDETQARPDGGA